MRRRNKSKANDCPVRDRCGATGKARYRSRGAAEATLTALQQTQEPRRHERRAYECVSCGGWHLTSKAA